MGRRYQSQGPSCYPKRASQPNPKVLTAPSEGPYKRLNTEEDLVKTL